MASRLQRPYQSPLRAEQARSTQVRILAAAEEMFADDGYTGSSIAAIARRAGVSAQTVYNGFGTKAALAKRLYDVRLAGDDEPVPMAQRPAFQELARETDPRRALLTYARIGRQIAERVGAVQAVLIAGAAAGDPDLADLVATTETERTIGTGHMARRLADLGALKPGLDAHRAGDLLWTLTAPEIFRRLTVDRGWSLDDYEQWLGDTMCASVLDPSVSSLRPEPR
jgi:AcrR family transcriptional regulator